MREWADVYVDDIDDRMALKGKALFFVPGAIDVVSDLHRISTNALGSFASTLKSTTAKSYAGRAAIKKAMDCQPVVYESAEGFINVCNEMFSHKSIGHRFTCADIVACVFCIKDFSELTSKLNLGKSPKESVRTIATATAIDAEIIESAIGGFRIIYNHAETIRGFIINQAAREGLTPEALGYEPLFKNLFQSSAKSDKNVSIKKKSNGSYVYRRVHLSAAPPIGHPWSILP